MQGNLSFLKLSFKKRLPNSHTSWMQGLLMI